VKGHHQRRDTKLATRPISDKQIHVSVLEHLQLLRLCDACSWYCLAAIPSCPVLSRPVQIQRPTSAWGQIPIRLLQLHVFGQK
jgi:hypothetical protein